MPENIRVTVGENAEFKCVPPRGHPEPMVSWTHNERRVDLNTSRMKLKGHNLIINDVTQHDQGQYRCVAQNTLGTRESPPAILKVLGIHIQVTDVVVVVVAIVFCSSDNYLLPTVKPYFIRAPEDVAAMSSEDIVFQCKVGGDPTPTITWKRQDGKMLNTRYVSRLEVCH